MTLNSPQLEAVNTTDGPLLVLAGAGTGKTKVLTSRVINIVNSGLASPYQILAVTFTNKAAAEMKKRISEVIGDQANNLWMGTFHGVAARILRRHPEIVGLRQDFTIIDDDHVHVTPSFLGSNPAEVRSGAKQGLRVLGNEEDLGRALVTSFTEEQRKVAILPGAAPREIITSNKAKVDPLSPAGLAASAMTPAQRKQLEAVVTLYARRFRLELADEELNKISAAGWDKVTFAWAGGLERGDRHYYRIQSPDFLIEFDNSQGNGNHIHSVWRDFAGDFGRDLLKAHYEKDHATAAPVPAVK